MSAFMIGNILKGHRIVEKIKDGSVGTVWKALDSRQQVIALKQLAQQHASRPDKVRSFAREARLTRALQHRRIVKVFEYFDAPPQPFFTMEFFDSENLKYAMWYLPQRVYKYEFLILRQVAEALSYLHAKEIIHKDLKPENILVAPNSEIRLIDFSLAQTKWNRLLQFRRRTEGTPLYMAPEQIRGERCDARTDIYAFGATMYELLTKRPPFLGTTERHIFEKHLKEAPAPMRNLVSTLSSDLDNLVLKMLAKKREDRFQDMTSIVHELSKWEKRDTQMRVRQVEPAKPQKDPLGSRHDER